MNEYVLGQADLNLLHEGMTELGLGKLTDRQVEQLQIYATFLVEYNEKVNLTTITAPQDIVVKHFLDSFTLLKVANFKPGQKLIDIGSGAGFPGVPLLIWQPELKVTLLDALAKRLVFLEQLLESLKLKALLVHARAEDAGHKFKYREQYDYATARAVSNLPTLMEYAAPFLKVEGLMLAPKGPSGQQEMKDAMRAASILGLKNEQILSLKLPKLEEERLILVFRKLYASAKQFPRGPQIIKTKPL